MKIKVNSDVFNIVDRIKQIDEGYYVLFNLTNKKFEIHNSNTKNSYCITLPYNQLDVRAINLLEKTHIKNYRKIVNEIEYENNELERQKINELKEISDYKLRELLRYSKINNEDVGSNLFKTTWV